MTRHLDSDDARLVIHDREIHLDLSSDAGADLEVGDEMEVIRGNGPREGQTMGRAVVTGFDDEYQPEIWVKFDGLFPERSQTAELGN